MYKYPINYTNLNIPILTQPKLYEINYNQNFEQTHFEEFPIYEMNDFKNNNFEGIDDFKELPNLKGLDEYELYVNETN